ncbi:unnamed protein product [Candidula unifasciata]|uniref:RING-type domain-containing protein n=1 Tax=Candidula unifasciata TaxID=100452 RepID=A0A8S3ZRN5_9EUPU|nr:unnamed protein product [Candidula unifasciata]
MMRAQCCICSDLFENCQTVNIAAVPCGHTFHEDCLMRWMETSSTCPSCRSNVKRNQIIKRLFFDIREDDCEPEDVDRLLNQIGSLKAQVSEKDKQKQEIAESRDYYSARFAASEADRIELSVKLHEAQNVQDVLQRDLRLMRKENAAFAEELKEFRKTQKRLHELQNIESILTGCDSEIQDVVSQYSEAGESSVKQLASLVTVVKREYTKAEKDNNENRRKLVHLRNALRHNKTEGSQSFHRALNEDSPNVAYTPPRFIDRSHDLQDDDENGSQNFCLTPDLFDDSPSLHRSNLKRKCLEELEGPKLKFANIPTAAERLQAGRKSRAEMQQDDPPSLPQAVLNILKKKLTAQSNSRAHVSSVITRGYDGFGGSETYVHTQGPRSGALLKSNPKKIFDRRNTKMENVLSKLHGKQPHISRFVQAHCHSVLPPSSSPSSLSSAEDGENGEEIKSKAQMGMNKPPKKYRLLDTQNLHPPMTMKAIISSSSAEEGENGEEIKSKTQAGINKPLKKYRLLDTQNLHPPMTMKALTSSSSAEDSENGGEIKSKTQAGMYKPPRKERLLDRQNLHSFMTVGALTSSSSAGESENGEEMKFKTQAVISKPRKRDRLYDMQTLHPFMSMKASATSSSSSLLTDAPKLSSDLDFIDLT